jgi:hypothetical protein
VVLSRYAHGPPRSLADFRLLSAFVVSSQFPIVDTCVVAASTGDEHIKMNDEGTTEYKKAAQTVLDVLQGRESYMCVRLAKSRGRPT